MKRVSVCLASYNGARFIEEQISSILTQLGGNDEIIVSDDSSTDETIEIIKKFKDSRIILIENQLFNSAVLNFENALKHAKGEYIFLSDQDDVWKPNKVQRMIEALNKVDLVISDCDFINGDGSIIGSSCFKVYNSGPGVLKNFIKNTYLGNCMAFNSKVLKRALPFPKQLQQASKFLLFHDVWIGLVANSFYKVLFIPDKLSSFRRHSGNASPTEMNARSPNSLSVKLQSRWLLLSALLNRLTNRG
jgi:glycosyltransferase involved in cell wall biosynthesis